MLSYAILFAAGMAAGGAIVAGIATLLRESTRRSGDINFANHVLAHQMGMGMGIAIIVIINAVLWAENALIPYLDL